MEEIWKDIPHWEGLYQVSNIGRVRSLPRTSKCLLGKLYHRPGRILKQNTTIDRYKKTYLSRDGKDVSISVHRLVALAFIPNPDNKPMINHLNSKRDDNRIENLEWCTNSENIQHSFDNGISSNKGEKHPRSIFKMEEIRGIRKMCEEGYTPKEVAAAFKTKRRNVYSIRARVNWNYE